MPITVKLNQTQKKQNINKDYIKKINKFHSNNFNEEEEEEVVKRIEPYITTFITNYNQKETVINTFLDKDENKGYNNYFSINSAIYFGFDLNNPGGTKEQIDEIKEEKSIVEPCFDMIKYTRLADSAIMPCKSVIDLIRQIDTPISFQVVEVHLSEQEVEKELKQYFEDSINYKTNIYEFLKTQKEPPYEQLDEKWIVFLNKKGAYVFYDIVSNQCQFNYPGKDFGVSYDDGPNFIKLPGTVQNKNIENIDLNLYKCITSPYAICKIMKILYEENNKNRQILKLDSLEKKWVVLLSPNNKQYYRLDLTTNITEWIQESNTLPPSSPFALLTNNPYDQRIVVNRVPTTAPPNIPVIPSILNTSKPKKGPLESPVGLVTTTLPPDNHVIPARSMKLDSRFHIVLPKGT